MSGDTLTSGPVVSVPSDLLKILVRSTLERGERLGFSDDDPVAEDWRWWGAVAEARLRANRRVPLDVVREFAQRWGLSIWTPTVTIPASSLLNLLEIHYHRGTALGLMPAENDRECAWREILGAMLEAETSEVST